MSQNTVLLFFHSSLTQEDSRKLEQIQKTCLKVILGNEYDDYSSALKICNLQTLTERREKRCLDFSLRCLKHPKNSRLFPENPNHNDHIKGSEPHVVNFARIIIRNQQSHIAKEFWINTLWRKNNRANTELWNTIVNDNLLLDVS